MEPEIPTHTPDEPRPDLAAEPLATHEDALAREPLATYGEAPESHQLRWMFMGDAGLRAGWSVLIFLTLLVLFLFGLGTAGSYFMKHVLHVRLSNASAESSIFGEGMAVVCMLAAGAIVALIEGRKVLDYNLTGSRRVPHFLGGLATGFAALSVLVGVMVEGGWLHFGPVGLTGGQILRYAALWGVAFLLVGLAEEGSFRCYLQFTLARGINFWWALAVIGAICLDLVVRAKGEGVWGVYAFALAGLIPCLWLHLKSTPRGGFWQAAWVTSTLFGFIHTGNNGENWIGIFAAAAIGFVFCVSVRLTGSAWWAIGCHAAWDWAETYFYGTADSGLVAKGHYLTTSPSGSALWSGGTDGPEGSLLVLPVIVLLLLAVLVLYGRRKRSELAPSTTTPVAA
jgi:membrane protease YdiL (CAAX protease family)